MTRLIFGLMAALFLAVPAAFSQQQSYVQIEAQPSLVRAQERVRDYASYLRDVNGFDLGRGWYGIALGPYDRFEAERELNRLRALGQIPQDSYIAEPADFGRQFWPVGAAGNSPDPGTITAAPLDPEADVPSEEALARALEEQPSVQPGEETEREAAASERRLSRAERQELQVALKWAGFYDAAIDGAFGRGTRNSMAAWQGENGYETTGILTTRQRRELLRQYNSVLEGLDLRRVDETRAGISIEMPMGLVAFDRYDSPFVHYTATGDLPVQVLLISRPGDSTAMGGLYEIMQTLEIVPTDGPRDLRRGGFTLSGTNDRIASHTEVRLERGEIKGFTLVWPAGDEARRSRVLDRMRESFETIPGVLPLSATADDAPSVDLVAGLQIRQPKVTASGFYIDPDGTVVTARDAVIGCGRITLEDRYDARILAEDASTGIAILRAEERLAPRKVAALRSDLPRLQTEIAVSGYSFGGVLNTPTLTFGTIEDVRGLAGEENLKRLALASLPGDVGGPVLDPAGAVLGMLLPRQQGSRQLPEDVSFAAKSADIEALLARSGLSATAAPGGEAIAPEDLTSEAMGMTVLVSCWE